MQFVIFGMLVPVDSSFSHLHLQFFLTGLIQLSGEFPFACFIPYLVWHHLDFLSVDFRSLIVHNFI